MGKLCHLIRSTLYIKGNRDVEVQKEEVTLGDILSMECSDKKVIPGIKSLRILKIQQPGRQRYVISVLEIIACIHEKLSRYRGAESGGDRYYRYL